MAIVHIVRAKGPNDLTLAREAGPLVKKHGAVSVRIGYGFAGEYMGEVVLAATFPDWESYGRAMQSLTADPEYRRLLTEFTKMYQMVDRSIVIGEEV
jgi:uncharacterized protein DUF6854